MKHFKQGLLIAALVAGTATVVGALTLNLKFRLPPLMNSVRPSVLADEAGNVLLGATPAKVEITNPPSGGGCAEPDIVSVWANIADNSGCNVGVYVVPAGKRLIITDIEVRSGTLVVCDSTGTRLKMTEPGAAFMHRSFSSGLGIGPGETVKLQTDQDATIMGRLIPSS